MEIESSALIQYMPGFYVNRKSMEQIQRYAKTQRESPHLQVFTPSERI
jgi:hypothetical protein